MIAVNSCQIGIFKKDKILLKDNKLFKYSYSKASSSAVFRLDDYIQFTLSSGTYSIDDFKKKIKAAVLQQKQNWNAPYIKKLKLAVVPENYAFTADNNFCIALGIPEKILKNINIKYSLVFSGSYKTQLVTTLSPKSLSLHCNQINKVKKLDGQPSSLLACTQVPDYETTFSPMHLIFLELDTHRHHLDFKILDENNNEVIPITFYLQLLNKQ